jgi:hypothetical protein
MTKFHSDGCRFTKSPVILGTSPPIRWATFDVDAVRNSRRRYTDSTMCASRSMAVAESRGNIVSPFVSVESVR